MTWLQKCAQAIGEIISGCVNDHRAFYILYRACEGRKREAESVEAKLGGVAVVAITLLTVYVSDPKTPLQHVQLLVLLAAAGIALAGSVLFRGYDPIDLNELIKVDRGDSLSTLVRAESVMMLRYAINDRMLSAKRACAWLSAGGTIAVIAVIAATRFS